MKKLIFLLLIAFPSLLFSQAGFTVGYSGGFGNAKDFNRVLYIYNQTANLTRDMNYLKNFYGLTFSFVSEFSENSGFEMKWQNRHKIMHSNWEIAGEEYQRELKFRSNFISFGGYGGSDGKYLGMSLDLGNFKGWTKVGKKSEIKDLDFDKIFVLESDWLFTMQLGFTFFAGFEVKPIGFRVYYQYQPMTKHLDNLDNVLIGGNIEDYNSLEDRFNNFGFEVYLKLGGY